MYIHIQIMAKTIMVSNEAYNRLKVIKEKEDKSFSDVIINLIEAKKTKTLNDVKSLFGIFKDDKEYDNIIKEVKEYWKKWTKKYA